MQREAYKIVQTLFETEEEGQAFFRKIYEPFASEVRVCKTCNVYGTYMVLAKHRTPIKFYKKDENPYSYQKAGDRYDWKIGPLIRNNAAGGILAVGRMYSHVDMDVISLSETFSLIKWGLWYPQVEADLEYSNPLPTKEEFLEEIRGKHSRLFTYGVVEDGQVPNYYPPNPPTEEAYQSALKWYMERC